MNPTTVLVVPAFNEAHRFDDAAFGAFLAADPSHHLCFVDDGSTDDTLARLEALRRQTPDRIDVLRHDANRGKGEAVRSGLVHAAATGAAYIGFADADLAAPLSEVAALRAELEAYPEAWAAIGSRVKLLGRRIERSEARHYVGRVFATFASLAIQLPVYDTQCGLKLFRNNAQVSRAIAAPFVSRWIFDVELIARLADLAGKGADAAKRIREVPLMTWCDRGDSHLGVADFLRAPLELWRIRRRLRQRSS